MASEHHFTLATFIGNNGSRVPLVEERGKGAVGIGAAFRGSRVQIDVRRMARSTKVVKSPTLGPMPEKVIQPPTPISRA